MGPLSPGGKQSFQVTNPIGQLELFPTDGVQLPRFDMGLGMQEVDTLTSGRHEMLGTP